VEARPRSSFLPTMDPSYHLPLPFQLPHLDYPLQSCTMFPHSGHLESAQNIYVK
jgi:hypothetical protein